MAKKKQLDVEIHSEDLQEIITRPPSWLLAHGTTFILMTVLLIFGLSALIRYPEIVHTGVKFTTSEAPKVVVAQGNATLTKILVPDGAWVERNQEIAYLASTAEQDEVLGLLEQLKAIRTDAANPYSIAAVIPPNSLNLGELQGSYQAFYLAYLNYQAVSKEGIFEKRKKVLMDEVVNVHEQNSRIMESFELRQQELALAEAEYEKFKALAEKKIISPLELQQKEAVLLAKRQTIPQMETSIISNRGNLLSRNREITEIENQMLEERKKFVQAFNSFISDAENWRRQYVLTAPVGGKLVYGSFLQDNSYVKGGEELFYINPNREDYYGEMLIPQANLSKVKVGQDVLVKVKSFPHQEYGYLKGKVAFISDIPIRDSVFRSRVDLVRTDKDSLIRLKPGISADAEIITADLSIMKRIWLNLTKSF